MSRKHYIALAAAIREQVERFDPSNPTEAMAIATVKATAEGIARALRADNSRFDHSRFMEACGFKGE
jgi:hypothetical protein